MTAAEESPPGEAGRLVAEIAAMAAIATVVGIVMWRSNDSASASLAAAAAAVGTIVLLHRGSQAEPDRLVRAMLGTAVAARIVTTILRYNAGLDAFGGRTGPRTIDRTAHALAERIRSGTVLPGGVHGLTGHRLVELLTGYVYTLTGHSMVGATIVFSWLGFAGTYLFLRAVRIAFPRANRRIYAAGVLLFPSMLLWTSAIGEPALLVFAFGLAAFGLAGLYTFRQWGWVALGGGLGVASALRPGVVAAFAGAAVIGYLAARPGRSVHASMRQLVGVLAVLVLMVVVAVASTGAETAAAQVPGAALTVLFRPTVFEAHGAAEVVAAVEVLLLLVALVWAAPRVPAALRTRTAYLWFALSMTVLYLAAYAVYGDAARLGAARVLALPFVLVIAAVPRRRRAKRHVAEPDDADTALAPTPSPS